MIDNYVNYQPYAHQKEAYEIAMRQPASALLMEQGTGKTLVALGVMGQRYKQGDIDRALVVCPASVMAVWERELHDVAAYDVETAVLNKGTRRNLNMLDDLAAYKGDALKCAVINYESLWRIGDQWDRFLPELRKGRSRSTAIMVADESQRIKNHRAKQSRFTHILGANVRYRLLLTGTPVTQSPLDFWSQYRYLDPTILPRSYYAFRNTYAVMGGYEGKQVVGYQNLDRLTSRVHSIAYRITKEQALDLPETINQERYVRLPPRVMREYKRMVAEDIALIEGGSVTSNNLLTRLLRLSQITGGHITTDNGEAHQVHDEKLKELMDIIDDTAGKVVVFARFTAEIKAIRSALEERGIGYGLIDGSVAHSKRGAEVQRFQEDGGCRVFIAQLQAAGLGITLTAASTAVFYSLNYSFADYDQCRARIHRIGQHYPCTYIHLVAEDTVDEKVLEILNKKGSLARLVVDEWRTLLKGD